MAQDSSKPAAGEQPAAGPADNNTTPPADKPAAPVALTDPKTIRVVPLPTEPQPLGRPPFLEELNYAYSRRGKSVVVLTGNTHDLYWAGHTKTYVTLEQRLVQAYNENAIVLRMDRTSGIEFTDNRDKVKLEALWARADQVAEKDAKLGSLSGQLADTKKSPAATLVVLRNIFDAVATIKNLQKASGKPEPDLRPIVAIVQFSGSLFPAGDWDKLGPEEKDNLVRLLNLIEDPKFKDSNNLLILVADTASELNSRIIGLPSVHTVEIGLPNVNDRWSFVRNFKPSDAKYKAPTFEKGEKGFVDDAAGFTLVALQALMEGASRDGTAVTRKVVLDELNRLLKAELGDIIQIKYPDHGRKDVIGYEEECKILETIFRLSEDPATATPGILCTGPSGEGKTWLLEAFALESERVVIVLKGLRSMWFGGTEVLLEKLRLRLNTYNKILIMVDEADTQFGRVDQGNTHETEKRLVGDILALMSDGRLFGKVVWAMMTSRPQCMAADIKSRCTDQVPVFPLTGEKRQLFVMELLKRKGLVVPAEQQAEVMRLTATYSPRNYNDLGKKAVGLKLSIPETLEYWSASTAILKDRLIQTLYAATHCSYPKLLPPEYKELVEQGAVEDVIAMVQSGKFSKIEQVLAEYQQAG